jgi:hypothetical protein
VFEPFRQSEKLEQFAGAPMRFGFRQASG